MEKKPFSFPTERIEYTSCALIPESASVAVICVTMPEKLSVIAASRTLLDENTGVLSLKSVILIVRVVFEERAGDPESDAWIISEKDLTDSKSTTVRSVSTPDVSLRKKIDESSTRWKETTALEPVSASEATRVVNAVPTSVFSGIEMEMAKDPKTGALSLTSVTWITMDFVSNSVPSEARMLRL